MFNLPKSYLATKKAKWNSMKTSLEITKPLLSPLGMET